MSQSVQELYPNVTDFEVLLEDARMNAANDWEETFVSDLRDRYAQYGRRMFLTEAQQQHLERIASDN